MAKITINQPQQAELVGFRFVSPECVDVQYLGERVFTVPSYSPEVIGLARAALDAIGAVTDSHVAATGGRVEHDPTGEKNKPPVRGGVVLVLE